MKKSLYLLFSYALLAGVCHAQNVKVSAHIDTAKVLIGDQVLLKVEVEHNAKQAVKLPILKDSVGKIEIVSYRGIDTISYPNTGRLKERQTYKITSFDTGFHAIPPLTFTYKRPGDTTTYTETTEAIGLSVFQPKVDTTKAIKDIKKPLDVPLTFREAAPWLIGGLLLVAIIAGMIYYLRKRKKGEPIFTPVVPDRPAHELALEALHQLETEKIWQQGAVKQYHSRLTDIVRTYIEQRFKLPAMEQTSDETLKSTRSITLNETEYNKLLQLLKLADMVKFAKVQPLPNENELSLQNAYAFINATLLVEVENTTVSLPPAGHDISENAGE